MDIFWNNTINGFSFLGQPPRAHLCQLSGLSRSLPSADQISWSNVPHWSPNLPEVIKGSAYTHLLHIFWLIYGIFEENFWHLCKKIEVRLEELYFEQEGKIGDLPNFYFFFRLVSLKMGV